VIKGLQEGLALMRPGSKWRISFTQSLLMETAGGQHSAGSLLIFDVELQSVVLGGRSTARRCRFAALSQTVMPPLSAR